jgi:hypothetical protein
MFAKSLKIQVANSKTQSYSPPANRIGWTRTDNQNTFRSCDYPVGQQLSESRHETE